MKTQLEVAKHRLFDAAGFDYIAGDMIADKVKFPAGVVPTELHHLYECNLRRL